MGKSLRSILFEKLRKRNSLLSEVQLSEYIELTYLSKSEINFILEKFATIDRESFSRNIECRFSKEQICNLFTELKFNPFSNRIFKVFSTQTDGSLCFEEFLNLCSVFSKNCPLEVKAAWAFLIFDFDEDDLITKSDICQMIDMLTSPRKLKADEKNIICEVLLDEMDLQQLGGMNQPQFVHSITKMTDFAQVFCFQP